MKRLIIAILLLIAPQASFAMDKNHLFQDDDPFSVFEDVDNLFELGAHGFNNIPEDKPAKKPRLISDDDDYDDDNDFNQEQNINTSRLIDPNSSHLIDDPFANLNDRTINLPPELDPNPLLQFIIPNQNDRITNAANDPSHNPNFVAITPPNPITSAPPNNNHNNHQKELRCLKCKETGKRYTSHSDLWRHIKIAHPNSSKTFTQYTTHQKTKFQCHIASCGSRFTTNADLQEHLNRHNNRITNAFDDLSHNPNFVAIPQANRATSAPLNNQRNMNYNSAAQHIINQAHNNTHITNAVNDPSHNPNFVAIPQANPIASAPRNNNDNNQQKKFFCSVPGCATATRPYEDLSSLLYHLRIKHNINQAQWRKQNKELTRHLKIHDKNNKAKNALATPANDVNHNPDSGLSQINQPASQDHAFSNPDTAPSNMDHDPLPMEAIDEQNVNDNSAAQHIVDQDQNNRHITNAANDRSHNPHFGFAEFRALGELLRKGLQQYENNKSV